MVTGSLLTPSAVSSLLIDDAEAIEEEKEAEPEEFGMVSTL